MTCTLPSPSRARMPLSDSSTGGTSRSGSRSTWFSTTRVTAPWDASGRQESVVHGGIGIFLRIEDPDQDVDLPREPLHNVVMLDGGGIEIGQVQQDQAPAIVRPIQRLLSNKVPVKVTCSQSSNS